MSKHYELTPEGLLSIEIRQSVEDARLILHSLKRYARSIKKNAIIYECKVCKNELIRKIPLKQDTSCSKCYPKFDRRFLFVLKEDNRINKMPTKPIIYSRILSRV